MIYLLSSISMLFVQGSCMRLPYGGARHKKNGIRHLFQKCEEETNAFRKIEGMEEVSVFQCTCEYKNNDVGGLTVRVSRLARQAYNKIHKRSLERSETTRLQIFDGQPVECKNNRCKAQPHEVARSRGLSATNKIFGAAEESIAKLSGDANNLWLVYTSRMKRFALSFGARTKYDDVKKQFNKFKTIAAGKHGEGSERFKKAMTENTKMYQDYRTKYILFRNSEQMPCISDANVFDMLGDGLIRAGIVDGKQREVVELRILTAYKDFKRDRSEESCKKLLKVMEDTFGDLEFRFPTDTVSFARPIMTVTE